MINLGVNEPDATMRMWRYMRFSRFIWLLQYKKLWLSRADFLGDRWEIPLAGDQLKLVIDRHPPPAFPLSEGPIESAMERVERLIPLWRRKTFVNCWSASKHESNALWRIYCGTKEGVALETDYARLVSSLRGPRLFKVSYEVPGTNLRTPTVEDLATKKRPMFDYEKEFRILQTENNESEALGLPMDWNPEEHLIRIIVHPDADTSFMESVVAAVAHYAPSLKDNVVWSEMRDPPPA